MATPKEVGPGDYRFPRDYDAVPVTLQDRVCGCGRRDSFGPVDLGGFEWWVCSACWKPAPLNALNARLIRECEMCEDPYFINHYPDRNDVCSACE